MNPYVYSAIGSVVAAVITAAAVVLAAKVQRGQKRVEEAMQTDTDATRQMHNQLQVLGDLMHVTCSRLDEHGRRLDEHIAGSAEDRRHIFALLATLRRHDSSHERTFG